MGTADPERGMKAQQGSPSPVTPETSDRMKLMRDRVGQSGEGARGFWDCVVLPE